MNFPDYKNMPQDNSYTDGLEELLFFMFASPSATCRQKLNSSLQPPKAPDHAAKRWLRCTAIIVVILLLLNQSSYAQEPYGRFASPNMENCNLLFFLQRDPGANTVVYELNYSSDGKLYPNAPIKASWIRYGEKDQFKELTAPEKKLAYGIKSKAIGTDEYEIRLLAYKKMPLYLKKSETDNKYHIYIKDEGKNLLLKRVFVKINKGTFRFPKVQYIDLITTGSATGIEILKRIKT